eukprot:4718210-Prymnesium_polylepis.2
MATSAAGKSLKKAEGAPVPHVNAHRSHRTHNLALPRTPASLPPSRHRSHRVVLRPRAARERRWARSRRVRRCRRRSDACHTRQRRSLDDRAARGLRGARDHMCSVALQTLL